MFDGFLNNGSWLGVLALCYAETVAVNVSQVNQSRARLILFEARIVRSGLAAVFVFMSLPGLLIVPLYFGLLDSFWSGVISLFIFGLIGGIFNVLFQVPRAIGYHLIPGFMALIAGYALLFLSWPTS